MNELCLGAECSDCPGESDVRLDRREGGNGRGQLLVRDGKANVREGEWRQK